MYITYFIIALFVQLRQTMAASSSDGWTYGPDSGSSCAGTTADPCGIDHWGTVSSTCSSGHSQSPINIAGATPNHELLAPVFHATDDGCSDWKQYSSTSTFSIDTHDTSCEHLYLEYDDEDFILQEMHFHSPSEHTIAGGHFSAEAHLVHESAAHHILVIGLFLEVSAASAITPFNNSFLDKLWKAGGSNVTQGLTSYPHDTAHPLSPYGDFLPGNPAHFVYEGSLTSPPCTEGVKWLVYTDPVPISQDDLETIRAATGANANSVTSTHGNTNRYPVQDLYDRKVEIYTDYTLESALTSVQNKEDIEEIENVSTAAVALASLSMLIAVFSLLTVCSMKSQLESLSTKISPQ